jgi:adenylate cyclase
MSDFGDVSRRLVFVADVEGYSRLMGADEVGTLKGLTEPRAILDRFIGERGGSHRLGSNLPAGFASASTGIADFIGFLAV